jgi:8-oxo-dGTP pyrophosphatase MutT (NUDIX family)
VDPGETTEEALKRELIEEVGCDCTIEKDLGVIIEYRIEQELMRMAYGYLCRVKGEIGEPAYEQGEIDAGFNPVSVSLDEAITLIDVEDYPEDIYQAKSIIKRETTFLKEAKKLLHM